MKKGLHNFMHHSKYTVLFIALLLSTVVWAQPQYFHDPTTGATANGIPFGQLPTGTNRRQSIYKPSDFNSPTAGYITKVYYKASTPVSPDLANVKIHMATTSLSAFSAGSFVTAGAVKVLDVASFTTTPLAANWIEFTLQTPFLWDLNSNLIVDVQHGGNITGFSIMQTAQTGGSLVGNSDATSASAQNFIVNFGFDVVAASPCASPPIVGNTTSNLTHICANESVDLAVDSMSFGLGQSVQWQSSTDNIIWANMANDTLTTLTTTVPTTRWFRAQVTCGTSTVSSTPVKVTVLTASFGAGTYTINSALPTSGSNYMSFGELFAAINCGGITGPIVINVTPNVSGYHEQAILSGVSGVSATNTITINGNGALITSTGGYTNRATLTIDSTNYVKIKNLTIEGTAFVNNYGIELRNSSDYFTLDSCTVQVNTEASVTSVGAFITSNNPTSPVAVGLPASNLTITNSIFEGGYYCLAINGPNNGPYSANNLVENNIIRDFYYMGLYTRGQEFSTFKNNDIVRENSTAVFNFYGLYVLGNQEGCNFTGNRLHNSNDNGNPATVNYPIYLSNVKGTTANPVTFANNVIYNINNTGNLYGINISNGDNVRFYHNTLNLNDGALGASVGVVRGLNISATTGTFDFQNNIFNVDVSGSGIKHLFYMSNPNPNYTFNHNQYNFTSTGGTNTFGYFGAVVADFAAWKAVKNGAFEQNGVSGSPTFKLDRITPQTSTGNAAGANLLATVPADINGVLRTTTPDIGAVEYVPLTCLQPLGFSGNSNDNSITLSWINDIGADSVHIEYGLSGFNQGTGIHVNATGSTITIGGLISETCYDFYVYTWCNGVAGNGTALFTHCTNCGAKNIPLAENFDSTPAGTSPTFPNAPNCWTYYKTGNATTVYGLNYSSLNPNSGPNHWRFYRSNLIDTVALISPELNGLTIGDKRVRFWAKSNTTAPTRLILGTVASPEQMNTFAPLDTFDAPQLYTEYVKTLNVATGYNGVHKYVVFMMANTTGNQSVYIDDIGFEQLPQCATPFGVGDLNPTATTSSITWGTVSGNCFKLEYGPVNFSHSTGQGTVIRNATSPQTISNLKPNTYYDVYVFDCCDTTKASVVYTFKTACASMLSGTYTINQNDTASATNFVSFNSFVQAIENCGVNGPVVANVVSGTGPYFEQVIMTSFPGASATNTVTINGNGNALIAHGNVTLLRGTLILDDVSRLIFKNLTVETTGSAYSYGVEFRNGTNNIVIDSCHIKAPTTQTITVNPVIFSDNPVGPTSASNAFNNITIKNSVVEGGYYALVLNGPTTAPYSSNNLVENTTIKDFYSSGLWMRGQQNTIIRNNDINRASLTTVATFYGMNISGSMEGVKVTGNRVHSIADLAPNTLATSYGIFMSSAGGSASNPMVVSNNLVYKMNTVGQVYAMHIVGASNHIQVYHNTLSLESYGAGTSIQRALNVTASSGNFVIKNNIFNLTSGSTGNKHLLYLSSTVPTFEVNNNQYYINGAGTAAANSVGYWGADFNTFASWQAANSSAFESNGVYGNPSFTDLATGDLTPIGYYGDDMGQNLLSIVPTDYYGVARTTTPDLGAIEFTAVLADIALSSANINRGKCLSTTDTVVMVITNSVASTINFATDTLIVNWTVTGPVNSSGTILKNSGTLGDTASTTLEAYTANLSVPGIYTFSAWLNPNGANLLAANDTVSNINLEVLPLFEANPKTATILNALDSVEISIKSPFLSGSSFFISEVSHYKYKSGGPLVGWPGYLQADDYIEITGIPGSDLAGVTLEQWDGSALLSTYTFPIGTLMSPAGTAIIAVGQLGLSVPSPTNFYYHGTGTYTGSLSATDVAGRILKDANNNIIDAVGYGTYVFPASSGVTAADWSGNTPAIFGSGNKLNGPDNNTASNWVHSSMVLQNPNELNANVLVPNPKAASGFSWSLNGTVIDTVVNIFVGPYPVPGVYKYVATYQNSPCGVLTDTVTVNVSYIVVCPAPTAISADTTTCTTTTLNWTSTTTTTLSTRIEYGVAGFTPGTGTVILGATAPQLISGLALGTDYDFYVRDSCAAGKSVIVKISETTATGPTPTAVGSFNVVSVTSSGADVQFDGTASAAYTTLNWDFGDLSAKVIGVSPLHTYTANGTYTVTIIADGECGADTTTLSVVISGIGLLENEIFSNFNVYPNPNLGNFNIKFGVDRPTSIEVSVVSLQGQILYAKNYGVTHGVFNEAITLEGAPAGVYLLQIATDRGIVTRRVTVNK